MGAVPPHYCAHVDSGFRSWNGACTHAVLGSGERASDADRLTSCLVLEADGILALSRGDGDARAALARARREGHVVVVPTPVLAQVHRGGHDRARVDRIIDTVDALLPTSEEVARRAGELQAVAGTSDPVDAIVVAEALAAVPALILTGDPVDLRRLLDTQPGSARVGVI